MATGESSSALQQLIEDDAVRQLRKSKGLMATLGSEDGALKLDWVEGVQRLLADNALLEQVEAEAREIRGRGIRHIIWAGMGGSIMAVHVLTDLGFCSGRDEEHVTIYPLDSTDPAALNEIVRKIAQAKNLTLPTGEEASVQTFLQMFLDDILMIGVSMGMTSEEPITHLVWFTDLLKQVGLRPAEHLLVMTLPGSYLDRFAHEQQAPSLPLQLDRGTGTGGRMSAPTTRVFLLPAALYLTRLSEEPRQLRAVLQRAWNEYDLALATERPADHPFVQLAAALSDTSIDGACRLLLSMPEGWQVLVPWIEQLMEESLGKGNKGVVVFTEQPLDRQASASRTSGTLHVPVTTGTASPSEGNIFVLSQPSLASKEPRDRLAAVAASFLGWQLGMALYGYLQHITFAGQPAVENYKARARVLRAQENPLQVTKNWAATATAPESPNGIPYSLLAPQGVEIQGSPASTFAKALQSTVAASPGYLSLGYLDLTINGELPSNSLSALDADLHTVGNELLGIPVKLRRAPAAYHSTEQSEMDGPPFLVSLRVLARDHEKSILGTYTDTFLCAQAVSTWQAMLEQARPCFLLIMDGSLDDADQSLHRFFSDVTAHLRGQ
jgi:glucose-6-phosphate isomerase